MSRVLRNLCSHVETTFVPRRRAIVMSQMAAQKIQFSDNTPQFSQNGGAVPAGYQLSLSAPEGEVYYTVDGADPRRPGAMVETGKTVLSGNAEKWAMVPSMDNGGNDLGKTWHGGKEPFDHDDWDSGTGTVYYIDGDGDGEGDGNQPTAA